MATQIKTDQTTNVCQNIKEGKRWFKKEDISDTGIQLV